MIRVVLKRLALLGGVILLLACDDAAVQPARDGFTRVDLESDRDDYIGQGERNSYTQADSRIVVQAVNGGISVLVEGDEDWTGSFPAPQARRQIEVGRVDDVALSWEGDNRACGTTNGWYVVDEVAYSDGVLTDLVFRFEQFCRGHGTGPSLRGEVRWSAFDSTEPPGPQQPVPPTTWSPPAGSIPTDGDYLYLQSDADDYIGQGIEWHYSLERDSLEVFLGLGGFFGFRLVHDDRWSGEFQVMNVIDRVDVGLYPELQRYPFNNPYRGGFSISGGTRGCNESRSWVAVDDVGFDGDAITNITFRFEQFCDGKADSLRGFLRWSS